jgi:uncharacterized protein with NRDE domain
MTPQEYVDAIRASAHEYNGFNLVLGDRDTLIWYSNKATPTRATASRWSPASTACRTPCWTRRGRKY